LLLAFIFSLSLGSLGLEIDEEAATANYQQEIDRLNLVPPVFFSGSLGGGFVDSPWNWSSVDTIFLDVAIYQANPDAFFTLRLFGAGPGGPQLINAYEGSTGGIDADFSLLRLNRSSEGSDDFSNLVGMEFVWEGPGQPGGGLTIRNLVGAQGEISPVITSSVYELGAFTLTWSGTGALPVNVQRRQSLDTGGWSVIAQQITVGSYTDLAPPEGQAFYRVVVP
jgi:hypothetical protein